MFRSILFRLRGAASPQEAAAGEEVDEVLVRFRNPLGQAGHVVRQQFVWAARVAGVIGGSDQYVDGRGWMAWKVLGLFPVVRAEGPDVSGSAAGRGGAELCWVPTSVLPRFGVDWTAEDDTHLTARFGHRDVDLAVEFVLDEEGRVRSVAFERWGDPGETGTWDLHHFGMEGTGYATFDGVTIPSEGRVGWFFGTDRWTEGEFFRFRIAELHLVRAPVD